jgi:DNA-binding response OmpR family regulator
MKILVIDDEKQIRDILQKLLELEGHTVFLARDGVEGIHTFHQFHPNIVITDIYMPEKDGMEVIVELMKFNPDLPIIAMSGNYRTITASYNLELARTLGAKWILVKPFKLEELRVIIADVVRQTNLTI